MLPSILTALKDNGVIIAREELGFESKMAEDLQGLSLICVHETDSEKIILFKKEENFVTPTVVDVSNATQNYGWIPELQAALSRNEPTLVVAQNQPLSGIMGFINCLRREAGGTNIRCVFVMDEAPDFDLKNEFYYKQLRKGLVLNVYKDGEWGGYRHLALRDEMTVKREHVFNNVTVRGDLSSLRWIEGPLTKDTKLPPEKSLIHVINIKKIVWNCVLTSLFVDLLRLA